jgi:hypothetical protein
VYLAADGGSDAADGLSATTARATLTGFALRAGDRVHLAAGRYGSGLSGSVEGSASCPIRLMGAAGHASVLTMPVVLRAHWRLEGVAVEVSGGTEAVGAPASGAPGIRVEGCRFSGQGVAVYFYYVEDGVISGSRFEDADVSLGTASARFTLRNNDFIGSGVAVSAREVLFEGNRFTGRVPTQLVAIGDPSGTARFRRNVFHDLVARSGITIYAITNGPAVVEHNTFLRLGSDSYALSRGVFRNNIVFQSAFALEDAPLDAGFNLYEGVQRVYGGGAQPTATDLTGPPDLDEQFVPLAGSRAIDAADPQTAVPPGGGPRADIGARERGATLRPDGRYCLP